MNKIESFFDRYTNDPKKAATLVCMILLIFLVVWIVIKIFGNKISSIFTKAGNQIQQSIDMQQIEDRYTGQQKSYTTFEYETMASNLYTAMKGAGTNEAAIRAVMNKMKNDLDVYALIDAFGTRDAAWPSSWSGTLSDWLIDELSTSDLEKYVNSVLKSKGISFRF